MKRLGRLMLVVVFLVVASSPLRPAQAATSEELLALIGEAYDNFFALESLTAESVQVYEAHVEVLRLKLDFTYHADITSEVLPGGDTFTAHSLFDINMTSNMEQGPMNATLELFMDGPNVYGRIPSASFTGSNDAGQIYPDWVNTASLPANASPAYQGINASMFLQLFGMNYLFLPNTVASVSELQPQEVDGQMMRVVQVIFTSLNLEAAGLMDNMVEVFNGQAMGAWTEDMTREMLSGSGYTFAMWIGEEDHLPHQFADFIEIESHITFQGRRANISATMATATEITSMNEALTLTPPELEATE